MSLPLHTNFSSLTAQTILNPTNRGLSNNIPRLISTPRFNQIEDEAGALSIAHPYQSPAAVVTISDEAKQKLAEYQQGTINNAAAAQQAKTAATVKDADTARETATFVQAQIQQQAGTARLAQTKGILSLLQGG